MAEVFLSYARPDASAAMRLARQLEKAGCTVWYDRDLPAHRAYADVIERELDAATAVVVIWSSAAVQSQWVRSEANRARELDKLVQARLDNSRIPLPFDQIQCADLSEWPRRRAHAAVSQIFSSIEALARADAAPVAQPSTGVHNRRAVLVGGAAALTAGTLAGGWLLVRSRGGGEHVSPQTAALMDQAKMALWQNTPEGQNQAIAIYRQVIADNPTYAGAWGRLALAYAMTGHWRAARETADLWNRSKSAAERALELEAHDAPALIALATAKPFLANWLSIERSLRQALAFWPKDGETAFTLAMVLSMVGRNRQAASYATWLLPEGPTPGVYVFHAQMLWAAGRDDDVDHLLARASDLYPTHFGVWFTRFYTRMMGGRPEAALSLAADTATLPTGIDPSEIEAVVKVARAIQSRGASQADAVTGEWMRRAHQGAGYAENAAQFMSVLGRVDDAFRVLRAYYFSEGFDCGEVRFQRSVGSFTSRQDRQTAFLFNPAMENVRSDPRFTELAKELRLTDYWQGSGQLPDYLGTHRV